MLTSVTVSRFKRFGDNVRIELGNPVVFVGPNDSGKTTALQALALWEMGLRRWTEKRRGKPEPSKRPGVAINRKDLLSIPVPGARLLWHDLAVRDVERKAPKRGTTNIRIEIVVEGITRAEPWKCGFEFDYANVESIYCRPLHASNGSGPQRMAVPSAAEATRIAFLPPMSGLATNETRLDPGAISVRLGEGRTAEVLRNLCYQVVQGAGGSKAKWEELCKQIEGLFGAKLSEPQYLPERGEITMSYRDKSDVELDLSSSGRGMQQTLLLLAYLAANPKTVLLLDEPDAHLEILRQRQIYQVLTEAASRQDSQVIIASHSEVVLNEAAGRDVVVAFLGQPHRIDDRGSQLLKALKEIGFEQYYQAEQAGWVLYVEGSTDLAILRSFANVLDHPAREHLERPFVHYVLNQPPQAHSHFYGLREAKRDLVGCAVFDRLDSPPEERLGLTQVMWASREIECYLCQRETLLRWAEETGKAQQGQLFGSTWRKRMEKAIPAVEEAMRTLGRGSPWSPDTKVSDDFLAPLFARFFESISIPNLMQKSGYHELARHLRREDVDEDVVRVLDAVTAVASRAKAAS